MTGFYALYSIRGTFYYEPNSGLITSTGNTTIFNIDFVDKPGGIYARAENISTRSPQIIDSGYTALFQGSLRFCGYSDPEYISLAEDYGYFSASVSGQAD